MIYLGIYLFLMNTMDVYTIDRVIKTFEGSEGSFIEQPFAVSKVGNDIWILDNGLKLWMINESNQVKLCASKGQGPGELNPFLKAIIPNEESISVLHSSGLRTEEFSFNGLLMDSRKHSNMYFYIDNNNSVSITRSDISNLTAFNTINLQVNLDGNAESVVLYNEQENDRINLLHVRCIKAGDYLFFYTDTSVKSQIYYLLLDIKRKEILDVGTHKLADKRIPDSLQFALEDPNQRKTLPVVDGCTYSSDLGFVLTENTLAMGYRILSIYKPINRTWSNMKILDNSGGFFYQHVKGNTWGVFLGASWKLVELNKIPD